MSSARLCAQRLQGRGALSAAIDLVPSRTLLAQRNVRPARCPRRAAGTRAQAASAAATTEELRSDAAATGTDALFQPLKLGAVELSHRVVMAPLTRCRALNGIPQPNMVTYYSQRATQGGLIVSEATCISDSAHGYPHTPTLYLPEAVEAWKPVVQAVHDKGGFFFMQLWHCGRASHQDYQPGGVAPPAPSAVPITGAFQVFSMKDFTLKDYPTPRALTTDEIRATIKDYGRAARNALAAGADGVEIHGASGYLINQFLNAGANQRDDDYGGSIEKRARFALEVAEEVIQAVGSADKVGFRFSPFGHYLITPDEQTYAQYSYVLTELNKYGLAYVHLVDARDDDFPVIPLGNKTDSLAPFRQVYGGNLIVASGYKGDSGAHAVASGAADAVAYGRLFISNPDLPRRLALGAPLSRYNRDLFYAQSDEGYIDYQVLEETPEGQEFLAARK